MSTYDVENPYSTDKGDDLLLACMRQNVSRITERMLQENKRTRLFAVHWSAHPHGEQEEAKNVAIAYIDYKKAYNMAPLSLIVMFENVQNIRQSQEFIAEAIIKTKEKH